MPELPEVETMVRGLRPAFLRATIRRGRRCTTRSWCTAATPRNSLVIAAGAGVNSVGRRGKWVVIELAGTSGIIVIQPRMTGGFWLLPPEKSAHVRLTFRLKGPCHSVWYCDARSTGSGRMVLGAGGGGTRLRPLAWPRRVVDRARRPRRPARSDHPRDQGHPHGPEDPGRHREYLRRRDPSPLPPSPPAACLEAYRPRGEPPPRGNRTDS